jgi:hypothetical protein
LLASCCAEALRLEVLELVLRGVKWGKRRWASGRLLKSPLAKKQLFKSPVGQKSHWRKVPLAKSPLAKSTLAKSPLAHHPTAEGGRGLPSEEIEPVASLETASSVVDICSGVVWCGVHEVRRVGASGVGRGSEF